MSGPELSVWGLRQGLSRAETQRGSPLSSAQLFVSLLRLLLHLWLTLATTDAAAIYLLRLVDATLNCHNTVFILIPVSLPFHRRALYSTWARFQLLCGCQGRILGLVPTVSAHVSSLLLWNYASYFLSTWHDTFYTRQSEENSEYGCLLFAPIPAPSTYDHKQRPFATCATLFHSLSLYPFLSLVLILKALSEFSRIFQESQGLCEFLFTQQAQLAVCVCVRNIWAANQPPDSVDTAKQIRVAHTPHMPQVPARQACRKASRHKVEQPLSHAELSQSHCGFHNSC